MLNNPKEHYRQKFMSRINSNDIMHKGFLRPTEIKLMDSSSLSDKDKGGLKLVYK